MGGKLTTEQVKMRLSSRGVELIGEWQGMLCDNTFKCSKGHTWVSKGDGPVNSGSGCPVCATNNKIALTQEEVTQRLNDRQITLASTWRGGSYNYSFTCGKCDHTWSCRGDNVLNQNSGCPACFVKGITFTTEVVNARLSPVGITLIGEWKGVFKKHTFECHQGHTWQTNGINPVSKGRGCPICTVEGRRLTTEQVNNRLKLKNIRLLSEWKGMDKRHKFVCELGHEWEATGHGPVTTHTGCPECDHQSRFLTPEMVNEKLSPRGICLIGDWNGAASRNHFKCDCGHEWHANGSSVVNNGHGCRVCTKTMNLLSNEQVNDKLKAHGKGVVLVGDWKGFAKDNQFRCQLGHTWEVTGTSNVANGNGCSECTRLQNKQRLFYG